MSTATDVLARCAQNYRQKARLAIPGTVDSMVNHAIAEAIDDASTRVAGAEAEQFVGD